MTDVLMTNGVVVGTDLVPVLDETAIDVARDPAEYMIAACERAKVWLVSVLEHGDIEQIVELKSRAEAIRVYTMQKNLGHDAELAAGEIVRRAERGLGMAIRRGQQEGTIRTARETGPMQRNSAGDFVGAGTDQGPAPKLSPKEFFANGNQEYQDAYKMTDGVSDEQFDAAIEEAKAEGNLSRANVVRKVTGKTKPAPTRSDWHRKAHHVKTDRVIEETIAMLEAIPHGLALIDLDGFTDEQRQQWQSRMLDALRPIRQFAIKEL